MQKVEKTRNVLFAPLSVVYTPQLSQSLQFLTRLFGTLHKISPYLSRCLERIGRNLCTGLSISVPVTRLETGGCGLHIRHSPHHHHHPLFVASQQFSWFSKVWVSLTKHFLFTFLPEYFRLYSMC